VACTTAEAFEAYLSISGFSSFSRALKTEIIIPSRKQRNLQQKDSITIALPFILEKIR
jgi:hypothetical protein